MKTKEFEIPLLEDIHVKNPKRLLWVPYWSHTTSKAFTIRQVMSRDIKDGGIAKNSMQTEVTGRAVVSVKLWIPYNRKTSRQGVDALLGKVMNITNITLFGTAYPLEKFSLCRTNRDLLCYYGSCYHDGIEFVIYIGSWHDTDESDFIRYDRSKVVNRDWKRLAQQLSLEVWAK